MLKRLFLIEIIPHKCNKCGQDLELGIDDFPWKEEHWICPKCDSTYIIESIDHLYDPWMCKEK